MSKFPKISIIYEDEALLLINKPAGIVVNRSQTSQELTIQDWLQEHLDESAVTNPQDSLAWQKYIPADWSTEYGNPEEIWQERGGIVHRLDKNTSGVLLLAKNPGTLINLLWQFKQRKTEKRYLLLCHGKLALEEGKIRAPLGRSNQNRLKFAVKAEGKIAETFYQTRDFYSAEPLISRLQAQLRQEREASLEFSQKEGGELARKKAVKKKLLVKALLKKLNSSYQSGFTLLEAWPKTGRTHQLRVHFSSLQHPLVADDLYLGRNWQKLDGLWCPRQFLHAEKLTFNHPEGGVRVTFQAELPSDLLLALRLLKAENNFLQS